MNFPVVKTLYLMIDINKKHSVRANPTVIKRVRLISGCFLINLKLCKPVCSPFEAVDNSASPPPSSLLIAWCFHVGSRNLRVMSDFPCHPFHCHPPPSVMSSGEQSKVRRQKNMAVYFPFECLQWIINVWKHIKLWSHQGLRKHKLTRAHAVVSQYNSSLGLPCL